MPKPIIEATVPYNWVPRDYQRPAWSALEGGVKRACIIWHRRAGKDVMSVAWTTVQAFKRVGLYWHVLPTYKQGRKIIWNGMMRDGRKFLDLWPENMVTRKRDDEMTLWLANGSMWSVIGGDDVDSLVGTNPVGVVFSEFSLTDPTVWNFIRPILAENGGWAMFIFTPRGRNHAYRMHLRYLEEMQKPHPRWFHQVLTVDDTHAISMEAIQSDRDEGMAEEMVQQEYWCSFDAPLVGAYYGAIMTKLDKQGRIGRVPHEPKCPVITGWDLGIGDSTAIWWAQQIGPEIRLIDFYQNSGVGIEHYVKVLQERADENDYVYREHLMPHDAEARELGTGKSLVETARSLGLRIRVVPKLSFQDGVQAVRTMLPQCWVDEENCEIGIQALREYVKQKKEGETGPDGEAVYGDQPLHNWASHPADALRTLAVGMRPPRSKPKKLAPDLAIV